MESLMVRSRKSASLEDFIGWLAESPHAPVPEPSAPVVEAARSAWQDFRAVARAHRADLVARLRSGTYYEELELLAAADEDPKRWLPRLRTANGFVVSALYSGETTKAAAPVGILVECPESMLEAVRGLKVRILCAGQWVDLGEIDVDGKAIGDLPHGVEFKPPLGLRVGELEERPEQVADPDAQQ